MPKPRFQWDEPFEMEGFWWRPEMADAVKRHGTLRFGPDTGMELTVFDLFEEFEPPERLTALHGETLGGKPCTVLNGLLSHHSAHPSGGHSESVVRAHEFFHGAHVDNADDLTSSRFKARVLGIREWLAAPFRDRDEVVPGYGAGERQTLTAALPGSGVEFVFGTRERPGAFTSSTETYTSVRFELEEETTVQRFLSEWLSPLLDFLVFATRQPSAMQKLTAELYVEGAEESIPPAIRGRTDPDVWRRQQVDVVRTPSIRPTPPPRRAYERILLPASALGEEPARTLGRWYELHRELRAVASYFFGGLAGGGADLRRRALDLMSFAEAYHRAKHSRTPLPPELHRQLMSDMLARVEDPVHRALYERRLAHANEQSQRERVADLFDKAQERVPERDLEAGTLPRALVHTRNYFTHWSTRTKHVLSDEELFWAVKKMTLVLQVNLLLDLGLEPTLVERVVRASYAGQRL